MMNRRPITIAVSLVLGAATTSVLAAGGAPVRPANPAGVLQNLPGFGREEDLGSEERAGITASFESAKKTMNLLARDLAEDDLEIGNSDELIGRLFARLEMLRRASRVSNEPAVYRFSLRHRPPVQGEPASAPADCRYRSDSGQARFATALTATNDWPACTAIDASPEPNATTSVLLMRRSANPKRTDRELQLEMGFAFANTAFALALVHDTARDVELAIRPRLRRHNRNRPY